MSEPDLSPLALAMGRIPTGLYVVTSTSEGAPLGFVGSFLMQVGFEPPTVCVAVGKGRDHLDAMRASGRFAVSILDGPSSKIMGAFFKKYEGGETAFDHVEHAAAPDGGPPVLSGALAWLSCRVTGEHETGDHVVVFGEVTDAAPAREGDPSVHLRKNGLAY
ncbi:MAG: flavin reductase family protein [Planctomycetota bacterium]